MAEMKTKIEETGETKTPDEYAEKPEEVLDKKELEELKKLEKEKETSEPETRESRFARKREEEQKSHLEAWEPKTKLGQEVKDGKIKSIDEVLDENKKIMEPEIVDLLLKVKTDLISIGQAKGKFGGGKRRAWRQTQRKTKEGNVLKFSAMAVAGDEKGHIGLGEGNSIETLPSRDKAIRKSKLNIFRITRKCSAFDCACSELHTIPFEVIGKSGSVRLKLIPAPQGTGLVVANELKKILKLAGIKDVYSRTSGKTKTTFNLAKACIDALKQTNRGNKK